MDVSKQTCPLWPLDVGLDTPATDDLHTFYSFPLTRFISLAIFQDVEGIQMSRPPPHEKTG
jgi:hypothetical protein